MKKRLINTMLASLLFGATAANAAWQPLLNKGGQKVSFGVVLGKGSDQVISVNIPGYELTTIEINGETYSQLSVPLYPTLSIKGHPDLPTVATNLVVPTADKPRIKIVRDDYLDIQLEHPLVSSKGHFTRDINPESVGYTFDSVYQTDAFYPQNLLGNISEPFVFNNVNGVNLFFNSFQYNPVKKILRVHKSVTFSVKNENPKGFTPEAKKITPMMNQVLTDTFANYTRMAVPLRLEPTNEMGRMVVICADAFVEAAQPFVVWKNKAGIKTSLVKASEVGNTPEKVKAFIQSEFDKGGLSYVHLIGDVEHIPTILGTVERAASDPSYALLAGNDWFQDVVISRFSAKSAKDIANQVAKTINYEAYPDTGDGAAWYVRGMGIASNEGNPKDWAYCNDIRTSLLGFTYKSVDQIYDPSASKAKVAEGVNQGRSVINYIGHGSNTQWVSSGFNNQDVAQLKNGLKLPIIWSVACVNGAFAASYDCFAEAWQKAGSVESPSGSAGIAAASTNMEWVPPLHWQAQINRVLLVNKAFKTFGGLHINGESKLAEVYGPTHKSFKMLVEQTNIFGDGSLRVRYDVPKKVEMKGMTLQNEGSARFSLVWEGTAKPAEGLTVTVYNSDLSQWTTTTTNTEGQAAVTLTGATSDLLVTVVGDNIVPLLDVKVK